ncbi:HAD family hydrolase [Marinobacter mangrovi]|uniref:HAD family hydrolase n=1 Tax=Marinobacter mangrovi TaxID=2803918 RepID=UPI001934676F|nr:HAD family hydrolase [Marinobacter mangrovi]
MQTPWFRIVFVFFLLSCCSVAQATDSDPLASWNDGQTKSAIVGFVQKVTDKGSKNFVPPAERVATFDNDGTLWAEQPVYFQALYALDRIRQMAPDHPDWKTTEPFKSAINGDVKGLMASGMEGVMKVLLTAHADVTAEAFRDSVTDWFATAKHPTKNRAFTQMVYQPMLELLVYLRANGFKTYIVSGGGVDFIRVFAEDTYGIPPEQVMGTTSDAKFEMRDGVPEIVKTGNIILVDDKEGKPVGIYRQIGRRPIMAVGNSDGDLQMLQYTTIPRSKEDQMPRMGVLLHHTDADREWAYDRQSHIGQLDKALDEAPERGWVVIDMKQDWSRVFPEGS